MTMASRKREIGRGGGGVVKEAMIMVRRFKRVQSVDKGIKSVVVVGVMK